MRKKTIYFRERKKHVYYYFQQKTIKFAISHSFIIFYLFLTGPIPLRIWFLRLLPKKKKNFHSSSLYAPLSLSLLARATLSLPLSLFLFRFILAPEFRDKRENEEINDVAVTFNDLLRIILLPCLSLSTCC
jgi:hypothetical protein